MKVRQSFILSGFPRGKLENLKIPGGFQKRMFSTLFISVAIST